MPSAAAASSSAATADGTAVSPSGGASVSAFVAVGIPSLATVNARK